MATILANIYATRYSFINKKFAKIVCPILEIELYHLMKLKEI